MVSVYSDSDIVIPDIVKVSGVSQILQETDPGKLFKGFWVSINNAAFAHLSSSYFNLL